jgi:hypothetical protein
MIKVILNIDCKKRMQNAICQNILDLETEILQIEENMIEFLRMKYEKGIKKSLYQLKSNLKYLSILANGAPIDKNEDRKIMDFLRTHYNYLEKLSDSNLNFIIVRRTM